MLSSLVSSAQVYIRRIFRTLAGSGGDGLPDSGRGTFFLGVASLNFLGIDLHAQNTPMEKQQGFLRLSKIALIAASSLFHGFVVF